MSAHDVVTAARARELRLGAEATAAWCTALLLAALAVAALVLGGGRWIDAPRWLPLAMACAATAGAVTIAIRGMRIARASANTERVAEHIERARGLRSGALVAGLQLAGRGALAAAGLSSLDRQLAGSTPARPPNGMGSRYPLARPLGALALALAVLALTAPTRRDGIAAMLRPVRAWRGTLLPPLAIEDAPVAVRRGATFDARLVAAGRRRLTLRERQTGTSWSERTIALDDAGRATVRVGPVNGDVVLVATDGRVSSAEAKVAAVDRAYLGSATLTVTAPAYLGGNTERAAAGVPLRVARGSAIAVAAQGTVALRSASLVSARDTIRLGVAGQRASGRFVANADGRWEWRAISAAGDTLDAPAAIDISVVADSAPSIAIAAPATDTIVATEATVTLRLIASDDHGLALVRLDVAPNGGPRSTRDVARSLPARWGADVGLDVASLGLRAGDATRLTAVAIDNSPWAQTASSRTVVIRVPGATEQRERVRAAADSLVAAATSTAANERDLARRTGEAARDRGERSSPSKSAGSASGTRPATERPRDAMSYESEQRARAVHEEQQKLSSTVTALKQRAADLQKQLDRAGALDSSLAAQLRDAQKLMQEAITPELAASLAALDSAVQSRNADAARSSLADLARQQEQLRQQLDRIAEMLSRAAIEGSLKTLHDEARDIAAAEHQRADSGTIDRAGTQALQDRAAKVGREAGALADRLRRAGGDQSAARTSDASTHAKQSADALGKADGARTAAGEMDKAAAALAGARQQQIGAWKQELAAELDRSIQEMMQLAQGERALEEQSRQGAGASSMRAEQSALQQGVEKTSERLEKAGRASSLLSSRSRAAVAEARRQSTRATSETARPQQQGERGAEDAFGNAADALTRAAAALVRDRERVNSSETATGFADMLKEMQQLAKQQGALNAQAASLFQMPGAGGAGSAQARALARQQREVARSLEELGNADGSGRADALAAEARRVAQALEQGETSAATRERQEQLLRRMLDAGRSLEGEERDEGKREATSATGVQLFNPGTADASGAAARRWREPTWEELRGLSAEERRAVIDYFRRMNAEAAP
jgi:hypothetical protein